MKGANSYGGGSYILGGTLNINSDTPWGRSRLADPNLTFAGGGAREVGAASVALSANRNISLDPGVSGTLDTGGNSLIVNGVISGGGHLFKTGSGTLTLTAGNDIAGYVFIDGNVLVDGQFLQRFGICRATPRRAPRSTGDRQRAIHYRRPGTDSAL